MKSIFSTFLFRAVNQLLDSGYECADEVLHDFHTDELELDEEEIIGITTNHLEESASPQIKEDEAQSSASSEEFSHPPSLVPSASSIETEAVRRHVESCFQLTNTISENTRR